MKKKKTCNVKCYLCFLESIRSSGFHFCFTKNWINVTIKSTHTMPDYAMLIFSYFFFNFLKNCHVYSFFLEICGFFNFFLFCQSNCVCSITRTRLHLWITLKHIPSMVLIILSFDLIISDALFCFKVGFIISKFQVCNFKHTASWQFKK